MLLTAHGDHATAFLLVSSEVRVAHGLHVRCNANLIIHEWEAFPGTGAANWTEHGVGTENVGVGGKKTEKQVARVELDREDIDDKGVGETLDGEVGEDGVQGDDAGGEDDDIGALVEEEVRCGVELDVERAGDGGVVAAAGGQDAVAVFCVAASEELAEGAKADDGDGERSHVG